METRFVLLITVLGAILMFGAAFPLKGFEDDERFGFLARPKTRILYFFGGLFLLGFGLLDLLGVYDLGPVH